MAFRRQGRWLAAAGVVVLAGLLVFFTRPGSAAPVRAAEVKRELLVSSLATNGKVEPSEARELRAAAPGFVRRVLVKEGDLVKAGQALLELDRGSAQADAAKGQADVQAAEAELKAVEQGGTAAELSETEQKLREARAAREEAARTLASNERLLARQAIARDEVERSRERLKQAEREVAYLEQRNRRRFNEADRERAQTRVISARAELAYARQQLGSTHLIAPMAGVVYSLPVRPGNFVNTGDLLARIGVLDNVQVRVFVDEPEIGRLARGQEVRVTWDALPGQEWKGAVERVPSEVTTLGTRSVGQVTCTIANPDHKLLANVNVDVEIITERRESGITVPKEAVFQTGASRQGAGERWVYVVKDDALQRRPVKVGLSSATRVEIVSGVTPGEKVALPGEQPLQEGMKVRVVS